MNYNCNDKIGPKPIEWEEKDLINISNFCEKLGELLGNRFQNDHPNYFIKCTTLDKKTYDESNAAGYSYFFRIINSLHCVSLKPNYHVEDYDEVFGYNVIEERIRVFNDVKTVNDIRIWCFDNVKLKSIGKSGY